MLRTFVVSIPYLGDGVDVVIATEGQKATKEWIFKLIGETKQRMEQHEEEAINKEYLASDEFIDLVIKAFDSAHEPPRRRVFSETREHKGTKGGPGE